jgi:sugar lactone lactonase YvrE
MRLTLALVALLACGPQPEALLTDDAPADAANAPRRGGLLLSAAGAPTWGEALSLHVSGAMPGEEVWVVYSLAGAGPGPCPGVVGGRCMDVLAPITVLGSAAAAGDGTASVPFPFPDSGPAGAEVAVQAAVIRGAGGAASQLSDSLVLRPGFVETTPPDGAAPIPLLGWGSHTADGLEVDVISDGSDGLSDPSDVEIDPSTGALWVVNKGDNSSAIISDPSGSPSTLKIGDAVTGMHFLAKPMALAFGNPGFFATAHDEDDYTQGPPPWGTPKDFMGPTLWRTDPATYDAGHGGHYDMLHNSPSATGIAWQADNIYWVFDGYHASLTRYDFHGDHGAGGADHSDGEVYRYVEGEVGYVKNVASHLAYDPDSELLYVADTGNNRIAVLDTTSGSPGASIVPNYDGTLQRQVVGARLDVLVAGDTVGLVLPAGLEVQGDVLFVSDHASSRIFAFDVDGTLLDWMDTGLPEASINGIAFGESGEMYVADTRGERIWRFRTP